MEGWLNDYVYLFLSLFWRLLQKIFHKAVTKRLRKILPQKVLVRRFESQALGSWSLGKKICSRGWEEDVESIGMTSTTSSM